MVSLHDDCTDCQRDHLDIESDRLLTNASSRNLLIHTHSLCLLDLHSYAFYLIQPYNLKHAIFYLNLTQIYAFSSTFVRGSIVRMP